MNTQRESEIGDGVSTTTYKIKIYKRRGRVGKGTLCRVTCLCKITKASGLKLYHGLNHFTTSITHKDGKVYGDDDDDEMEREQIYAKRVFAKVNFGGTHITMRAGVLLNRHRLH